MLGKNSTVRTEPASTLHGQWTLLEKNTTSLYTVAARVVAINQVARVVLHTWLYIRYIWQSVALPFLRLYWNTPTHRRRSHYYSDVAYRVHGWCSRPENTVISLP